MEILLLIFGFSNEEMLQELPNNYPEIFVDSPVYQGVDEIDGGNLSLLITASVKNKMYIQQSELFYVKSNLHMRKMT